MAKLMFAHAEILGQVRRLTGLRGDIVCRHGAKAQCARGSLIAMRGDMAGVILLERYRAFMCVPRCYQCGHVNFVSRDVCCVMGTTVARRLAELGIAPGESAAALTPDAT